MRLNNRRAFILGGILLVCLLLAGISFLTNYSFFVTWKNLGNPAKIYGSTEKVDRILGAATTGIRVGTESGEVYEVMFPWNPYTGENELLADWKKGNIDFPFSPVPDVHFGCTRWVIVPPLLRFSVDHAVAEACRQYVVQGHSEYAIDWWGNVWAWRQTVRYGDD